MQIDQDYIIEAINHEIEDREAAHYDTSNEVDELLLLRGMIETRATMNYKTYEWVAYIVSAYREQELRVELE